MTPESFRDGCVYLMRLRPRVYQWRTLRFWTFEQLSEELATVAQEEDQPLKIS